MSSQQSTDSFRIRDNHDRRIRCVTELLRLDPSLRTRELAKIVEVTPSHLDRLFKKQVGVSIREFSLELRLHRAKQLLETTFRCLKEIRKEVGIPDAANFSRLFKKRFGMGPAAFRSQISRLTNKYPN